MFLKLDVESEFFLIDELNELSIDVDMICSLESSLLLLAEEPKGLLLNDGVAGDL